MKCRDSGVLPAQPRDDPGREILRGETATSGGDVAAGEERLIQYVDARCDHPRLRRQIGARRHVPQEAELGQHERPRALRSDELALGVELFQHTHDGGILDDLAGRDTAADDDGVGPDCLVQARHLFDDDAVHRRYPRCRGGDGDPPVVVGDPVEQAEGDQ